MQVLAQSNSPVCHIHTVQSQNGKFFLKTFPFNDVEETSLGKTIVYNSESVKLYELDRHFELSRNKKEVFLSNDGQTIVYVLDKEFEWDGVKSNCIEIFTHGKSVKQIQMKDLIDCDSQTGNCSLFFKDAIDTVYWDFEKWEKIVVFKEHSSDFEKQLTERATFLNHDTLYIFSQNATLFTMDLNAKTLISSSFSDMNLSPFFAINPVARHSKIFWAASFGWHPKLASGNSFEHELAKSLNMTPFKDDQKNAHKFKDHTLHLEILVAKDGSAMLYKIDNESKLPQDKIEKYIATQKFEMKSIHPEIEKWKFSQSMTFMHKSKAKAKREKRQELKEEKKARELRTKADSINGYYIPKNLEECFDELNRLLSPEEIEKIKNLDHKNEIMLYQFKYGDWIQNIWGFWGGSRLQKYLASKGIKNEEFMSVLILEFYYDWLNGRHEQWRKFEKK